MGIGASNPVDESTKREIEETIKALLLTFTTEYVKWTAIFMVQKAKKDAKKVPSEYKLLKRPGHGSEPLREGYIVKEGGIRKSWKKRYLVARPDCSIEYYESEADYKAGKKSKGSIGLCGYHVVEDPNAGVIQRLKALAEKMKIDLSELPKPKEYPPLTMELNHWRRRSYYITLNDEDDFKKWVQVMRQVAWRSPGLKNQEWVHKRAFDEAIRRTRWSVGRWGWWSYGGTEEQILSDLISDQLEWAILGNVYYKIQGPWVIRNKIRKQILKTLDSAIAAAVKPAWAAMEKAVDELKPKVAPALEELGSKIGEVEVEIQGKITEGVMSVLTPLLAEHVSAHLGKIYGVIREPMSDAFHEAFQSFDKAVEKANPSGTKEELEKGPFRDLDRLHHSWELYDATRKLDPLYEPLWALNLIFPDIWPWWSIWNGQDAIRSLTDNAIYTFEQKLLEEGQTKDSAKAYTMELFKHDAILTGRAWYARVFKKIIMPPFNKIVVPAVAMVIDPLDDAVPDAVKQFVNPKKLFADILVGLVNEIINTVLSQSEGVAEKREAIEN